MNIFQIEDYLDNEWIQKEMRVHESEYTEYEHLKIFASTWNANGKKITEDLKPWIYRGSLKNEPDV